MEQNENFTLNICPPDGFFVADPDKAVVTIVDDTSERNWSHSLCCYIFILYWMIYVLVMRFIHGI